MNISTDDTKKKLKDIEDTWGLTMDENGLALEKTPAAHMARDQVLYLINTVRGIHTELEETKDELIVRQSEAHDLRLLARESRKELTLIGQRMVSVLAMYEDPGLK